MVAAQGTSAEATTASAVRAASADVDTEDRRHDQDDAHGQPPRPIRPHRLLQRARAPLSRRRSCTGSPGWLTGLTAGASGMPWSYFLHLALRALVSNSFVRVLVGPGVTGARCRSTT